MLTGSEHHSAQPLSRPHLVELGLWAPVSRAAMSWPSPSAGEVAEYLRGNDGPSSMDDPIEELIRCRCPNQQQAPLGADHGPEAYQPEPAGW